MRRPVWGRNRPFPGIAGTIVALAVIALIAVLAGWLGPQGDGSGAVLYHRWHGAPRMYWSRYEPEWVNERARALAGDLLL